MNLQSDPARHRARFILVSVAVGVLSAVVAASMQRGNPLPPDQRTQIAVPRPGTTQPTPNTPAPSNSGKPIIQASDITYLGALRMPDAGVDTTFAYGGMTGRVVNGRVHLFLYGKHPSDSDPVYEIEDPDAGYMTDYHVATRTRLVTAWGDIYKGRRQSWNADGSPVDLSAYQIPDGLYWNDATQLLYWTYYDSYNVSIRPDWGLGASSLDDPATAHSTAYGPWRAVATDGDNNKWYGPWRCRYLFSNPLDGSMMCGSGISSGNSASPWGPDAYGGRPWPTASTPAGRTSPDLTLPKRYLGPTSWAVQAPRTRSIATAPCTALCGRSDDGRSCPCGRTLPVCFSYAQIPH